MSKGAADPTIVRRQVGRLGAVAAWGQRWAWGSVVAALMTLSLVLVGEGAPGDRDPTFGDGGLVTTDFTGMEGFDDAFALVLQPDGKLVAAGRACLDEVGCDYALARYRPNGSLDPTFGTGGKVTTDFGGVGAFALVLQPDGKLVAAGNGLVRYLPDGRLDPTFGDGGTVTTDLFGVALILQPDGKLVAAGSACVSSETHCDFGLVRYLSSPLVNNLVTFEPLSATFTFTPDPTGCPEGFVGTFSFAARLTNISASALTDLVVAVTELTNGNLVHADEGLGGVGAQLSLFDLVLSPDEFVDVPFIICLFQRAPFTFVVDVLGVVDAGAEAHARASLAR